RVRQPRASRQAPPLPQPPHQPAGGTAAAAGTAARGDGVDGGADNGRRRRGRGGGIGASDPRRRHEQERSIHELSSQGTNFGSAPRSWGRPPPAALARQPAPS